MSALTLASIVRFVAGERGWPLTAGVERVAQALPAVACAGFEFALAGEDGPLDLQQRIKTPSEIDRLRHALRAQAAIGEDRTPLLSLCDRGIIGHQIDEIWLEVDHNASTDVPSVFGRISDALTGAERQDAALRLMAALGMESRAAQQAAITRCFEACAHPARVSHLGVMLSRAGAPLYLVIDGVALADATGFLDSLGWPGSATLAQRRIDRLCAYFDRIRLTVTIGDTVEPGLGLECFVGTQDRFDPRWRSVLDRLVVEGLCDPRQRDRMLAWPAAIAPHSAAAAWPDALVIDALARSPAEIGWLDCRISHVKVSLHDDRPERAKGYLGFVGVWEAAAPIERAQAEAALRPQSSLVEGENGGLTPVILAAVEFLLGARTQTGWWLDYDGFREGVSDEWVTAYVASALAEVDDPRATGAARRAWALLSQRSRDGWGWNSLQPADADSTIWALRLAARLGEMSSPRAQAARAFLLKHLSPDGGVATYLAGAHTAMENGAAIAINPGWYAIHGCVTAAAATLESTGDAPLDWLRAHQRADGCWDGYWWADSAYTTAHAVDALLARGDLSDSARVGRAVDWARARVKTAIDERGPLRSPFATALAICPLLSASPARANTDRPLIEDAVDRILAGRHDDGSWPGSATLCIQNAAGAQVTGLDRRRTLTTATVLSALLRITRTSARMHQAHRPVVTERPLEISAREAAVPGCAEDHEIVQRELGLPRHDRITEGRVVANVLEESKRVLFAHHRPEAAHGQVGA
jgi:hypothetical protein